MIAMILNFSASLFGYFLTSQIMKYFNGDVYTNFITMTISDILSCNITAYFISNFGIKRALIIGYLTGCAGMLGLLLYTGDSISVNVVFVFIAVFGNAVTYTSVYSANQIVFDTKIIAASFSLCNFSARSALLLAPQVAELKP